MTEHFHSEADGCEIKTYYKKRLKFGFKVVDYYKCETHHIKICRCGWEYHWHYGENTKTEDLRHFRKHGLHYRKKFKFDKLLKSIKIK